MRRSYLDYLIERIDPGAGFAFGFVDAQAKATYDFDPRHQVSVTTLLGRAVFDEGDPDIDANEIERESIARGSRRCRGAIFRARDSRSRSVCIQPVCATTTTIGTTRRSTRRGSPISGGVPMHRSRRRRAGSSSSAAMSSGSTQESDRAATLDHEWHGHAERVRRTCVSRVGVWAGSDRSRLAAHRHTRGPRRSLAADERRPPRPGSTPSCVSVSARVCAAAAASIVSFPVWTRSTGFRAAVVPAPAARVARRRGHRTDTPSPDAPALQRLRAPGARRAVGARSEPRLCPAARLTAARSTPPGSTHWTVKRAVSRSCASRRD